MFDAHEVLDGHGDLVGLCCEHCAAPDSEPLAHGAGEDDAPQHCDCARPLKGSLTSEGVQYVLGTLSDMLAEPDSAWTNPDALDMQTDWYRGSPRFAVAQDWAEDLQDYSLEADAEDLRDRFLERCRRLRERMTAAGVLKAVCCAAAVVHLAPHRIICPVHGTQD